MEGLITLTRASIIAFSAGYFDRMDSQNDADKQTDPVVSPLLLQWEMKNVIDFYDLKFDFIPSTHLMIGPSQFVYTKCGSINIMTIMYCLLAIWL